MKSADRCNLVLNVRAQELTVAQLVKIICNMLLNLSIPVRVVLSWFSYPPPRVFFPPLWGL